MGWAVEKYNFDPGEMREGRRRPETKLFTEFGLRCMVQIPGERLRIAGHLVGVAEKEFLILRVAAGPNLARLRDYGGEVITRFVSEGTVYGFRSRVVGTVEYPALAFIGWPSELEVVELRAHERVRCFLQARLHTERETYAVAITDLSAGGCQIVLNPQRNNVLADLAVNDLLLIELDLGDGLGPRMIGGIVKNIEDGERRRIGVMFTNLDGDLSLALEGLVERIRQLW